MHGGMNQADLFLLLSCHARVSVHVKDTLAQWTSAFASWCLHCWLSCMHVQFALSAMLSRVTKVLRHFFTC